MINKLNSAVDRALTCVGRYLKVSWFFSSDNTLVNFIIPFSRALAVVKEINFMLSTGKIWCKESTTLAAIA